MQENAMDLFQKQSFRLRFHLCDDLQHVWKVRKSETTHPSCCIFLFTAYSPCIFLRLGRHVKNIILFLVDFKREIKKWKCHIIFLICLLQCSCLFMSLQPQISLLLLRGTSREVVPVPGDPLTFEISLFDQNMLLKSFWLKDYRSHETLLLLIKKGQNPAIVTSNALYL